MYESEITQFLNQLKQQRPTLEQGQQQGRALLWDKELDLDAQADYKAAHVPQKPYVYSSGL
jgi:hypothetical protein